MKSSTPAPITKHYIGDHKVSLTLQDQLIHKEFYSIIRLTIGTMRRRAFSMGESSAEVVMDAHSVLQREDLASNVAISY